MAIQCDMSLHCRLVLLPPPQKFSYTEMLSLNLNPTVLRLIAGGAKWGWRNSSGADQGAGGVLRKRCPALHSPIQTCRCACGWIKAEPRHPPCHRTASSSIEAMNNSVPWTSDGPSAAS